MAHAGVNPVETYMRAGKYPKLPPTPYTPGNDLPGTVERVGANVKNVKVSGPAQMPCVHHMHGIVGEGRH